MADVRDFGAVGDGVADDTGAIEHALADGDGLLVFPRGEYRISRPIKGFQESFKPNRPQAAFWQFPIFISRPTFLIDLLISISHPFVKIQSNILYNMLQGIVFGLIKIEQCIVSIKKYPVVSFHLIVHL